jgi:hypothetical protein
MLVSPEQIARQAEIVANLLDAGALKWCDAEQAYSFELPEQAKAALESARRSDDPLTRTLARGVEANVERIAEHGDGLIALRKSLPQFLTLLQAHLGRSLWE